MVTSMVFWGSKNAFIDKEILGNTFLSFLDFLLDLLLCHNEGKNGDVYIIICSKANTCKRNKKPRHECMKALLG